MQDKTRKSGSVAGRIFRFYADGFRGMTVGRTLWTVIAVKVLVIFGVLKLFFFPDFLETRFETDQQRSDYVLEQITEQADDDDSSQERD